MLEILRYRLFDVLSQKDSLKRYTELREIQNLPNSDLQAIQCVKLRKLVSHAYSNSEYYQQLFKSLKLTPHDIQTPCDLQKLPILTKDVVKKYFKAMKARQYSSYSPRIRATSGSTGEAFHFAIDKNSHSWVHGYMLLAWRNAGFRFGDKVVRIGGGNIKIKPYKRRILSLLKNTIDIPAFDFTENRMTEIIQIINNSKPGIIYGYSSALALLAKHSLDHSYDLFSPKGIVTTAENLLPHNRDRIEHAFGAKVFDQYGVMECGITAYECQEHNGLHIGMTKGILEVVDDSGNQIFDSVGRIVGTDLDNYAFPILRYDSGDLGVKTQRLCPCGIGFELLDSIEGRTREFLTTSSGKKVHGAIFSYLVRENPWIDQYQVYQKVAGEIEIRLVTSQPITEQQVRSVKEYVLSKCGKGLLPRIVPVSSIPASKNNKRHFVVSDIGNI